MSEEAKLLGVIERNATEEIHIAVKEYKGKKYVDLRIFYTTDEGDNWLPTKKGITVAPDKIEDVKLALTRAQEELGIIPGEEEEEEEAAV